MLTKAALAELPEGRTEGAGDRGDCPAERDHTGHRHSSRADIADVALPDIQRRHLRNAHGAGIYHVLNVRPKKLEEGNQDQPGHYAACKHQARNARTDDITHAEVLRRDLTRERRARIPARVPLRLCLPEREPAGFPHHEFVEHTESRTGKHLTRLDAPLLATDEHVCAGLPFGVDQRSVFSYDERHANGYDKQHTQQSARKRQRKNTSVVERKSEEDEGRQREDGSGRDRLARRADRLDYVIFEDG